MQSIPIHIPAGMPKPASPINPNTLDRHTKETAFNCVDSVEVDDISDAGLAHRVLASLFNDEYYTALPRSLQDRVSDVRSHIKNPEELAPGNLKQHFKDAAFLKTNERIQKITKFVADYTELVNPELDRIPINSDEEAEKLAEALRSITDPQGSHKVPEKFAAHIADLKDMIDSPEIYGLRKESTEAQRFHKILVDLTNKRINDLLTPEGKKIYVGLVGRKKEEDEIQKAKMAEQKEALSKLPAPAEEEEEPAQMINPWLRPLGDLYPGIERNYGEQGSTLYPAIRSDYGEQARTFHVERPELRLEALRGLNLTPVNLPPLNENAIPSLQALEQLHLFQLANTNNIIPPDTEFISNYFNEVPPPNVNPASLTDLINAALDHLRNAPPRPSARDDQPGNAEGQNNNNNI